MCVGSSESSPGEDVVSEVEVVGVSSEQGSECSGASLLPWEKESVVLVEQFGHCCWWLLVEPTPGGFAQDKGSPVMLFVSPADGRLAEAMCDAVSILPTLGCGGAYVVAVLL